MRKRWWWVVGVLVAVGAPIAWYLGSPLFISRTVDEPFPDTFPMSAAATVPEGLTKQEVEAEMVEASKQTTTTAEPMPGGVSVLARGTFTDADDFHKGSGTALIAGLRGEHLVRLEDFQVTNGPDLYVYLTAHPKPATREDIHQGFLSLGRLKGNIGAQNYEIPADVDLSQFRAVVIYCQRFHVLFATATLGGVQ